MTGYYASRQSDGSFENDISGQSLDPSQAISPEEDFSPEENLRLDKAPLLEELPAVETDEFRSSTGDRPVDLLKEKYDLSLEKVEEAGLLLKPYELESFTTTINSITDRKFRAAYPDSPVISSSNPDYNTLSEEWLYIRNCLVLVDHIFYQEDPGMHGASITPEDEDAVESWFRIQARIPECQ